MDKNSENTDRSIKVRRYAIVLVIFGLAMVFGRDFQPKANEGLLLEYQSLLGKYETGEKTIGENEDELVINNQISTSKNEFYRLVFDMKLRQTEDQKNIILLEDEKQIKTYVETAEGKRSIIGTLKPSSQMTYNTYEVDFRADDTYKNLVFTKDLENKGNLSVRSINISKIEGMTSYGEGNITPALIGRTDTNVVINANALESRTRLTLLNRKNMTVGQVFYANEERISGIALSVKVVGNGGTGDYKISLFEVNKTGNSYKLGGQVATSYFQPARLPDYLIEENIYYLPIAARIKKDRYYYVAISNEQVKFNYFNTLELFGTKSGDQLAFLKDKDNNLSPIGNLYYQVYGARYTEINGERMLTRAIVDDAGNGHGRYSYETYGEPTDFLDLDSIEVPNNQNSLVFYDSVQRGISGVTDSGVNFIYKFDTMYPFGDFRLEAEPIKGDFSITKLQYSFDKQKWNDVLYKEKNGTTERRFEQIIKGNGGHILYVRIFQDNNVYNGVNKIKLFGLKKIKVNAVLNINQ